MLVLSRNEGQSITIPLPDGDMEIRVKEIRGGKVRLLISAPAAVKVYRNEVYDPTTRTYKEPRPTLEPLDDAAQGERFLTEGGEHAQS